MLAEQQESRLANSLRVLEKWGFGLSRAEVLDIVQSFVERNEIKTRFKDNRPGDEWFVAFRKRHTYLLMPLKKCYLAPVYGGGTTTLILSFLVH